MAVRLDLPETDLRRMYVDEGLSSVAIAKQFSCNPLTVRTRLREYGIALRRRGWHKLQRHVADSLLAAWPNPRLAYVVGLIASDGNLPVRNNCVVFTSSDEELAGHFKGALGLSHAHVVRIAPRPPRKGAFVVQVCDYALRDFLEARGLTPKKTLTIGALDVPAVVFRDFLRGELDGDGNWSVVRGWRGVEYLVAKLTSKSEPYLQWLRETVKTLTTLEGSVNGHGLVYNGQKAEALGEWLYYDMDLLCLERKRAVWRNWIHRKGSSR